jgi:hypothetical protein
VTPARALLVLLPAMTAAQTSPQAYFDGVYNKLSALTLKKDANGLSKLLKSVVTADFVYVPAKGPKLSTTQLLSSMRSQFKAMGKINKSAQKLDKVVLKGDRAVVTVSSQYAMEVPTAGKKSKLVGSSVSNDTWVNTPKGWRLKEIKTLKETATLDGKPIEG